MKLPNCTNAVVDLAKLRDYCLNVGHPEGRHKARVFRATLGMFEGDAEELRSALLVAAQSEGAFEVEADQYGVRYVVDFTLHRQDRDAQLRSAWFIRKGEDFPRLTTCYILRGR